MDELPLEHRRALPFKPGKSYRYMPMEDVIESHRPETIAYAAIAGNHRAVEFLYGDASIPQYQPLPPSNDIECAKCGVCKPRTAFTRDKRKRNGLASYCRNCERGRVKVYRIRHARWFEDANESTNRTVNQTKSA